MNQPLFPDNWRDRIAMSFCYLLLPAILFAATHAYQISQWIEGIFR